MDSTGDASSKMRVLGIVFGSISLGAVVLFTVPWEKLVIQLWLEDPDPPLKLDYVNLNNVGD